MKKLAFLLVLIPSVLLAETKELYWEDLVPKGFEAQTAAPMDHTGQFSMEQMNPNAPVVEELNGKTVKIPGFVVPLEGDEQTLTEFLLVPYFGACIHVPPPPSNQLVHVKFETGAPIESLYDAVWITGKLSTKGWTGDIASVGYTMTGISVEPYE